MQTKRKSSTITKGKMMQNQIIPEAWTRKDVARICGGISIRTVERSHARRLRPAELRNACRREVIYDSVRARRILERDRVIPRCS